MATCIDIAGATYPADDKIEPLQGKSLLPLLEGHQRPGHEELYFQFSSCRALRKGDWKIVSFYGHQWELYNLAEDRCEQNDLADKHPGRVISMSARWHEIAVQKDRLNGKLSRSVSDKPSPHTQSSWHKADVYRQWEMPNFD